MNQEDTSQSQPLAPIAPFHLNFQAAQPQTPAEKPPRRKSENTPLIQQPRSPDTTPVLKTRPTVEAKLVQTPARNIFDQENRPPSSISAKRGVLVQPKTPKTPKPKSLSLNVTDFEPFVFKLLGRLRYPNWRRMGMEINGLDHEDLMRVFSFFLALFDETLGYIVDKGGFSKAFADFRASFRQVGFHMTLTKRNFLSTNKKPVLPYLKMIVDKVIQKYGSVEKLCRCKFDYNALLEKYEQRRNEQRPDQRPASSLKRRRRQSVPNDAGRGDGAQVAQRKVKRRRTSDASGLISARKKSTSPSAVRSRGKSQSPKKNTRPTSQREVVQPQQQPDLKANSLLELALSSSSPSTGVETVDSLASPPDPCGDLFSQDVEMKNSDSPALLVTKESGSPTTIDETSPMDVDEEESNVDEAGDGEASSLEAVASATKVEEMRENMNGLLVEKDMTIEDQAMQIEKLGGELSLKVSEMETLAAEKEQLGTELEVARRELAAERERVEKARARLEGLEQEKMDREKEKQELWEKISKTSDQYQATLQQKESVINDLMNQVSTLKLQLAQNRQALTNLEEERRETERGQGGGAAGLDGEDCQTEKVTVIGRIDFGRHIGEKTLSSLRVADLQKYLKANGLETKGRKRELVGRIEKHFST